MGKPKRKASYRRTTEAIPPLEFAVDTENGMAIITARHLKYHELLGLQLKRIGETNGETDTTGQTQLAERVAFLAAVTTAVDTGDPDDPDIRRAAGDWAKFYRLPGNENLAWLGWAAYLVEVDGQLSKSGASDRGDGAGEGGGAGEPDDPTLPHLSAVRGQAAAGAESAAPV